MKTLFLRTSELISQATVVPLVLTVNVVSIVRITKDVGHWKYTFNLCNGFTLPVTHSACKDVCVSITVFLFSLI